MTLTVEVFNNMLDGVVEWNAIAGNDVNDKSLIPTYLKLSREEFFGNNELLQSWFNEDKVGTLDGLCDLVFTYGYLTQLKLGKDSLTKTVLIQSYKPKQTLDFLSASLILDSPFGMSKGLYELLQSFEDQFDIVGAFEEVLRSNMSKFPLTVDVYIEDELELLNRSDRYGDIDFKFVGDRVVFLAGRDKQSNVVFGSPKIIKPSTFSEPELEVFVK